MPKYEELKPEDVHIGRAMTAEAAVNEMAVAIVGQRAGRITPEEGENVKTLRRILGRAAKQNGFQVRSSVNAEGAIIWKAVNAKAATA